MKRFIALVLVCICLFNNGCTAMATESQGDTLQQNTAAVSTNAADKIVFAKKMDEAFKKASEEGRIKAASMEEKHALMAAATFAETDREKEEIGQELAEYGIYILNATATSQTRSYSGDVSLAAPTIFYEAIDHTWTVTCGGNWLNNNWHEQYFNGDVGGMDAFGVGFTNTSNNFTSYVVSAYAQMTDSSNREIKSTSNRDYGDSASGFGFQIQDEIYNFKAYREYIGYRWYGSCTYNYNFASYSGIATAYYIHTYSSTHIQSISFGQEGKTAGISVTLSSYDNYFQAYSNDTPFGGY